MAICWAQAHPHVFVEARSKLVFDDSGNAVAVQHVFRFDDAFTAFAIQGFDVNNDGIYSREELAELAQVNVDSMADFGYFTFGDNTRVELDFNAPTDYWLEVATVPLTEYWTMKPEDFEAIEEDRLLNGTIVPDEVQLLELHFTLPIKDPSDAANPITLDVYDPTYYVDFRFGQEESAVGTANAPGTCQVTRKEPPPLDAATAYALAQIGPEQRTLPPELQMAAATQVNQMIVTCAAVASAAAPATNETETALLRTREASSPEAGAAPGQVGAFGQFFGWVAIQQKEYYQEIISSLRQFRSDPNAFWILVGLSFAYGVFHAAGPGHGKAIITSYVLASNETLRKGIALSFVSALAQAITAIVLVGGIAVAFNLTSIAIEHTAYWLEVGSYALITVLGLWLLWQKALRPLFASLAPRTVGGELALAGGHGHNHMHHDHDHHHHHDHGHHHTHNHAHHDHGHGHHHHDIGHDGVCSTCGHAHAPTPDMLSGKITLGRAASIVLAIGLRPCTGALVVLSFALAQGMVAAGIASTLVMAVGTGITVSILAGLAVGAQDVAVRLFGEGSATARIIHRSIEIMGASIVFLLGLVLLVAALGWG